MLALLTLHTLPLMKTLMMRKEDLEEEGIQGIILEISKLRLQNFMAILTQRTILIEFKPLKRSLNLNIIMIKSPPSWPFLN